MLLVAWVCGIGKRKGFRMVKFVFRLGIKHQYGLAECSLYVIFFGRNIIDV